MRVGVHTGEVERPTSGRAASPCTWRARVVAEAGAGEVLVTQTTHDLVEGSGLAFDDRGLHALRGIETARRLYAAR